jgi:Clp amino terminal domain, pathogenicity island component
VFERFTEEARQAIVCAQEEARALNHHYIGTEHILLGLLSEEERIGGDRPLHSLGITLEDARQQVRRIVGSGEEPTPGQVPFTPRAKKVLELALREALSLGHNWIGPEHILLGIVREDEGVASRVLLDFDADALKIRNRVVRLMPPRVAGAVPPPERQASRVPIDTTWLEPLPPVLERLPAEIREELGREPDLGDLLLAIACARATVAGQALVDMGIDLDALWGTLERIRQQRKDEKEALTRRLDEVRARKREALEGEAYAEAGQLRDEERELLDQTLSQRGGGPEVLAEIRRRLGLPDRS